MSPEDQRRRDNKRIVKAFGQSRIHWATGLRRCRVKPRDAAYKGHELQLRRYPTNWRAWCEPLGFTCTAGDLKAIEAKFKLTCMIGA